MPGQTGAAPPFAGAIPEDILLAPDVRAAMEAHELGVLIRALLARTDLTQTDVAEVFGMEQPRVSQLCTGVRTNAHHVRYWATFAHSCGIPPEWLGFPSARPVDGPALEEVDEMMERREFLSGVLAVALGATVPSDAIRAAVPAGAAPITRRRLGLADVETLEKMTAGIRSATFANGGGLVMSGAVAQVNQARELESVMCSTAVRDRLLVATAELANVAAWTAYDGGNLSAARRLFQYSLDAATRSGDERAADIAVCTFQDMAHMSLHLETAEPLPGFRYAKEALQFMHLAEMRADESPINPVTRGYTAAMIARVQGVLGNADKARRALDESAHAYSGADPENVPRWMAFVTDAEIEGQEGRMLYGLALRDPKYAADAAERLRKAVAGWGSAFGRNAALDLSGLATVEVIAGDLDSGVTNGHRAADAIAGMNFPRGRARLVTLSDVANRHNDMSDVRDLQDHIAAVLAAVN